MEILTSKDGEEVVREPIRCRMWSWWCHDKDAAAPPGLSYWSCHYRTIVNLSRITRASAIGLLVLLPRHFRRRCRQLYVLHARCDLDDTCLRDEECRGGADESEL